MKQVSTGGLPFREIRRRGKYYVDKTLLIKDMLDAEDGAVYLYTRPRRFGKTTNLTMLDAFFNIEYEGNDWFDGLAISGYPEFSRYRNAFPVISLNLKDLDPDTEEGLLDSMCGTVIRAMAPFREILESGNLPMGDSLTYSRISARNASRDEVVGSIRMLCRILHEHYGKDPIILIDEYDRAITDAFGTGRQETVIKLLGRFMSATLKDNEHLRMAYVTGIMQVAKANIFSGLNNLTVNSVFSRMSDERFGFTEAEVRGILDYYGRPERFKEVREWYDGYRFGDAEVYNPFSVMMYVQNGFEADGYWVNSGKSVLIRQMLRRVDLDSLAEMTNIVNGNVSECAIHMTMDYDELSMSTREDLYSVMVMTGYLNAVPAGHGRFGLSVPNAEVMSEVERLLRGNVRIGMEAFSSFNAAILDGDADRAASILGRVLCDASYFDLRDEVSYELIVLTIMHTMLDGYEVTAQRESGNGRADLVLRPRREGMPSVIIELKVSASEEDLSADAEGAIAQIHRMRYYLGMNGTVILMGVAFWGKVPEARSETIVVRR